MALKSKPLDDVRPDLPLDKVSSTGTVRVNLNVPRETHRKWKKTAVELDLTLTQVIHRAMKLYLQTTE